MPNGIRVRLRRSSASEFVVRTDSYELVEVVRGPPIRIYVRRLPEKSKKAAVIEDESAPVPEPVPEPELVSARYQSSEDERVGPSEDRLTSRQRSLKMAQEAEEDEDEDESDEVDEDDEDLGPISKEEAALRKSEMRRRRRLALDKIEEQAKQETIERLLKKTSVRKAKSDKKRQRHGDDDKKSPSERRRDEMQVPHPDVVRYRNFIQGDRYVAAVTWPDGYSVEFAKAIGRSLKKALCGCGRPKLYSCAKTATPLCSLTCYQQLHTTKSS